MILYNSIELSKESIAFLKGRWPAIHKNEFYHHITLNWKPAEKLDTVGQTVLFRIDKFYYDKKGQCITVILPDHISYEGTSKPHITLSCADGVKPVYSNEMIGKKATGSQLENYTLSGTVVENLG